MNTSVMGWERCRTREDTPFTPEPPASARAGPCARPLLQEQLGHPQPEEARARGCHQSITITPRSEEGPRGRKGSSLLQPEAGDEGPGRAGHKCQHAQGKCRAEPVVTRGAGAPATPHKADEVYRGTCFISVPAAAPATDPRS